MARRVMCSGCGEVGGRDAFECIDGEWWCPGCAPEVVSQADVEAVSAALRECPECGASEYEKHARDCPQVNLVDAAARKVGRHTWEFPSGATLKFRTMSERNDVYRFQGHKYQYMWCAPKE